uniref:Dynein regulatory complex protein 12 n=1 Tax=Albugo laibachii Nc14 TaxID=890382 RepID=F0WXM8_9STRA|nr:conserved hypothetical protein [Albugo laibachii Nc14]|eukprot:CCA26222.1 conserved hypothetical protein [Albugo laibachii Nc14]
MGPKKVAKKSKEKDSNGVLAPEEQAKLLVCANRSLQMQLAERHEITVKAVEAKRELQVRVADLKIGFEKEREDTFGIAQDMTRQYKSMQEELLHRVSTLEKGKADLYDQLEGARTAFEAMQREKDDIITMKNEEIEELKGKMNDMAHEFSDMLKETLGKMRERIEITDTSFQFVIQIHGYDMSLRRVMESKCTQCGGNITMPDEVLEMLILYGHFIPEPVAAAIILGIILTEPSLRPDFIASAMNELLTPLQTDHVYDVVVPKRREGLGMSLRMYCGDLVVGGFVDFDDNTESPAVAARCISVAYAMNADKIRRLEEKCKRIEEETDEEFVFGYDQLVFVRQRAVMHAFEKFKRRMEVARHLYQYECDQTHRAYASKCAQHKEKLKDGIIKEIEGLQQARDGVSVLDRRRTKRQTGGTNTMALSKPLQNNTNASTESSQNLNAISDSGRTAHEAYFPPFNDNPMAAIYGEEKSNSTLEQLEESISLKSEQSEQKERKNLDAMLGMEYVFAPLQEETSSKNVEQDLADIRRCVESIKNRNTLNPNKDPVHYSSPASVFWLVAPTHDTADWNQAERVQEPALNGDTNHWR